MVVESETNPSRGRGSITTDRAHRTTAIVIGGSVGSLIALNVAPAPYSLALLIVPIVAALWLAFLFLSNSDFRSGVLFALVRPGAWELAVAAACVSIIYGLMITHGSMRPFTYVELTIGVMCFGLAIVSGTSLAAADMRCLALTACGCVILLVVLPAIVLAFLKYAYLLTGQQWGSIHLSAGEMYPWGTSLRLDSNLFALPILIAIVISLGAAANVRVMRRWGFALLGGYVALAFYVGINAASRRFVVLLAFGVLAVLALEFWRSREGTIARALRSIFLIIIAITAYPILDAGVHVTAEQLRSRLDAGDIVSLPQHIPQDTQEHVDSDSSGASKAVSPAEPKGTVPDSNSDTARENVENKSSAKSKVDGEQAKVIVSGTSRLNTIVSGDLVSTRSAYWKEGLTLLLEGRWIVGEGFSYQREISCRVATKCDSFDYPHNFVLSHSLFAGGFGFIASLAIVYFVIRAALLSMTSSLWEDRVFAVVLAILLAFSLFSGDTVFGIPALCAFCALRPFSKPCSTENK